MKARDSGVDYPVGVQPPLWLPEFPYSADVGDVIMMTGGRGGGSDAKRS